jgi:predicted DNA-binding transcriptional regulator AlpA
MYNLHETPVNHRLGSGEMLLPRRALRKLVPVSDMTIYRWERDGIFPKHFSINGRNYWRLSEVQQWMDWQVRASTPAMPDDGDRHE